MKVRDMFGVTVLAIVAITMMQTQMTAACSCMPQHSQTHYCKSEYAILARIWRKQIKPTKEVYKIEIKKVYKMSEKAKEYLKEGRLTSASSDSMCGGLNLRMGRLYVIAGNTDHINTCTYVKDYMHMTLVDRRGFAGGYKKGCSCEIKPMFRLEGFHQSYGACNWKPFSKCETNYGACIPARGLLTADGKPLKCHWRNSQPYAACRKEQMLKSANNAASTSSILF